MIPQVLKLDVSGCPVEWVNWQIAATLYARQRVKWEAGDARFTLRGGNRDDGSRSSMTINSIIAVQDRSRRFEHRHIPLTNRTLFQRDRHICLYCGGRFNTKDLTRDHVVPASRGGKDVWSNVATACRSCNQRKDAKTPEEARMPLLAVPYRPDPASYLLLIASGRRITACQASWLESFASKDQRLS
jgi:5-methylcytosine-specific restriction endonuclease McrA